MNKSDLFILQAASVLHDAVAVESAHAEALSALNEAFNLHIEPIEKLDPAASSAIIFVATGGVEEMVREAVSGSALRHITLVADGLQNSLAASLEISAWLRTQGIDSMIVHGTPEQIVGRLRPAGTADALRDCRVGLFGEPSSWLIASDVDYKAVSARFGIEFIFIPLSEVEQAYESATPDDDADIRNLPRVEPSDSDLDKALRLSAAIDTVARHHRLDALTIRCFDLLDSLHTTGCLALAMLNARGIPAGCEGDVPSLLTMLLARRVAGCNAFMANPSRIDTENNDIILAHCTLPLDMAPRNILRSHFESGIGVALQGILTPGDVTVVKWWGKEMDSHFISGARLIENLNSPAMCRTQIRLHLDAPVDYFLTRPLGNHHIILPGDHTASLQAFFDSLRD